MYHHCEYTLSAELIAFLLISWIQAETKRNTHLSLLLQRLLVNNIHVYKVL